MVGREARIFNVLTDQLTPLHLKVVNESHNHSVPKNSETHFNVFVVAQSFVGVSRVQRQRMVFDLLKAELTSGLHALTLKTLTPEEWTENPDSALSPVCHSKK